jgi:hypothetical protein
MRSVSEYLKRTEEFEGLAAGAPDAASKKRFADIADCYRLFARERKRLIETGAIERRRFGLTTC